MSTLYRNGDELEIVAGLYKKYRYATYLRPILRAGVLSCNLLGDNLKALKNLKLERCSVNLES
jgi:hypothetical protein